MNWEDKSNNEILMEIQQIKAEHEALKTKMVNDYDRLIHLEEMFDAGNKVLTKRLKGE